MKSGINSPIGGFGNHIRWLILLDDQFKFDLTLEDGTCVVCNSLEDKINFIKQHVYTDDRSWHNWLLTEKKFRFNLDKIIFFDHFVKLERYLPTTKILGTTIDPVLAHRCYFKFNSNLNNNSEQLFRQTINDYNVSLAAMPEHPNLLKLNVDCLYAPELDKNFYQDLITFFELEDRYTNANEIHTMWYSAHVRSELQFVQYVLNFYPK